MSVDYWRLTNRLLECVGAAYPQAVPADRAACGGSNFWAGQAVNPWCGGDEGAGFAGGSVLDFAGDPGE